MNYRIYDEPVLSLSRPLLEKLTITEFSTAGMCLLDEPLGMGSKTRSLHVITQTVATTTELEFAKCIVNIFGASARLRVHFAPTNVPETCEAIPAVLQTQAVPNYSVLLAGYLYNVHKRTAI